MKFLSRNAPALDARIVLNPREKDADFLESAVKKWAWFTTVALCCWISP